MAGASSGIRRIVVGVDGSEHGQVALKWAIALAREVGATKVVAVFAFELPANTYYRHEFIRPFEHVEEWREELTQAFETKWCAPLKRSGLKFEMVVEDGRPAAVIADVAERVNADLIVVGRRGRGGLAEMLLGSVSHELSRQAVRPVALISQERSASKA
ncbi:MAG: universal stress protein [Acidimicrobiales bacterium]